MEQNNKKMIFMVFAAIIVIFSIFFSIRLAKTGDSTENGEGAGSPATSENPANVSETEEKVELVENGKLIPVAADFPPESTPDEEIAKNDAEAKALEIAVAAQKYYDDFSTQAEMVSKNGYFYDFPGEKYVDNQALIDSEMMPAESLNNKGVALYLNTVYLNEIGGFDFKENPDNPLTLVGVYQLKDSFVIKSADGSGGEISKEKMAEIMAKHNSNHGPITRYHQDSDPFKEMVKALSQEFEGKDLDVRYLAGDEKYAFAVVSPMGEPANIRQFVLVKDGDEWVVGLTNLQQDMQFRTTINKKYPDLNMGMVPSYNLYYYLKYVQKEYDPILESMKSIQMIEKKDGDPEFICGTDEFIYMTFETGKKYVGKFEDGGWNMHLVDNFESAEIFLMENNVNGNPPLFLVKQEY